MTTPANAARLALDRLERANRRVTMLIIAAATFEFILLALVLITIDFQDATHRVMFLLAVLTYTTLAFGLVAVGAHVSRVGERLLNALELLRD
jgi:hypothetical protein